jgi:hypothetical protein
VSSGHTTEQVLHHPPAAGRCHGIIECRSIHALAEYDERVLEVNLTTDTGLEQVISLGSEGIDSNFLEANECVRKPQEREPDIIGFWQLKHRDFRPKSAHVLGCGVI